MNIIEKKEKAYELFMNGMSIAKSSKKVGIDEKTLSRYLRSKNVDTKIHSRKYKFNEDYFKEINTEEKAYWLGFIYADGCVNETIKNKGKNKVLNLEILLKLEDKYILEKFINYLGITDKSIIKNKSVKLKGKNYDACKVSICSTKLCKDLINLGVTPRKSLTLIFPKEEMVCDNLLRHFIRGYFDGDGNIGIRNTSSFKNLPRISVLGTEKFLNSLKNIYESKLNVTSVKLYSRKGNEALTYQKTGDDARSILRYMYEGASVYLVRKYKIYEQFCRLE